MSAHESILVFGSETFPTIRRCEREQFTSEIETKDTIKTQTFTTASSRLASWTDEFYPTSVIEFGSTAKRP